MFKNFLEWMGLKEKLHKQDLEPLYFREGELWWAHLGENVGIEINGKGDTFTRPIIVYKKFNTHMLLVIPLTSIKKKGTWYINFDHNNFGQTAVLPQVRTISSKRLYRKIGEVEKITFSKIREGFKNLYF